MVGRQACPKKKHLDLIQGLEVTETLNSVLFVLLNVLFVVVSCWFCWL